MSKRGTILAALAAAALGTASAQAADLGGMKGGSIKDGGYMPAIQQGAQASGMYFRGDFGFARQNLSEIYEPPAYTLSQPDIANTRTFGFGVGRYFSNNLRGDVTVDWRREARITGFVNDGVATVQGERVFGAKNMVALANLYYDFDTRSHFTPYLGVGLGIARNTTSAGHVNIAYPTGSTCDPAQASYVAGDSCAANFAGATKTNAAAALMAGFSARLHDRLHLDAGYRFIYMGGAKTGDIVITRTIAGVGSQTQAADPIVHDLHAHEVRVGLRWNLNR